MNTGLGVGDCCDILVAHCQVSGSCCLGTLGAMRSSRTVKHHCKWKVLSLLSIAVVLGTCIAALFQHSSSSSKIDLI